MPQYRIIRRLAIGGMAEVFLGKLVGTAGFEKPVAIKRLLPTVASDPKCAEAFLREARLCVHLVHPNVVQVLDLGRTSGQPFLVMELVDGEDLRRVIVAANRAGQPVRPDEALCIACCVAEALAYAFEATGPDGNRLRVVHRDVNPSNVLISMRGEVKLADFGVAKAADGREATQGELLKGKIGYLAPELLAGAEASHASDIFLAGTLLYELLAGKPLFDGDGSTGRTLAAISAHDETRLELPPGAPPELLPVLRRALARSPEARHPHASDLVAELRNVMDERRFRVSRDDLSRRMATLFPGRQALDRNLGAGVPLREDRVRTPPAGGRTPLAKVAVSRVASGAGSPPVLPFADRPDGTPVRAVSPRRRLGEALVEGGLITETQLQTVLARQRSEGGRLGEWVVNLEYAPARSVLQVLAKQLGVPFVSDENLLAVGPSAELLVRMPQELALRLLAMPLTDRDGHVFVAMTDPADLEKLDLLRFRLGPRVKPVVATEFGIRRAIARLYGGRADDLKWRQLDPDDPRTMISGRMIDFEAEERAERERAAASVVQQALAVPAAFPSWSSGAGTVTPGTSGLPGVGYGFPQAFYPGGFPAFPYTPGAAFSPGYPVAFMQAGVGPDGRPVYVAVPAHPQPLLAPPANDTNPPPAVGLEPVRPEPTAEALAAPRSDGATIERKPR